MHYTKTQWKLQAQWEFNSAKQPEKYSRGGEDGLEETPFLGDFGNDLLNFAGSPAWQIINLTGSHQLSEKTLLNFGLHNIFDIHYRPFASGISAPGRNLSLGFKMDF